MDKDELLDKARDKARDDARSALDALIEWRKQAGREDPMGRDVSIAVTSLEDALLRLVYGTPR